MCFCTDIGTDGSNPYTGNGASSNAFLVKTHDPSSSFVGKIEVDDTFNTTDTNGYDYFATNMDMVNFESWFRSWGREATVFSDSSLRGSCVGSPCRIWDWRLRATDTKFLNRSGDGLTANDAFVAGANCPTEANGAEYITSQNTNPINFLRTAVEIMFDGVGNDNGFCESNEACIYTPNIGAYQGEGDYLAAGTCIFSNDLSLSNVELYAYPTNGI